ncbi:MAG: GTP-binding protein [Candidatus Colwellbacteria bacterium]|nr:GTP-binding protein [Candidatus Colwellbacteria bacterium]
MAENTPKLKKRPPVVVVLGHVDHGKTSLLDYIRQSRVAAKEAGGITQATGGYEIIKDNEKITFIDTPGHEAFRAMRMRGATAADIAVLVVAADEGPKPQTEESVKILEESNTPYIVAITKIDSPRADIDKVKNDLMNIGVFLEGYGGSISWQGVSSKTGEGVSDLLDIILLLADVSEFKYDEDAHPRGFIIESRKDNRKGLLVSLILKNGTLRPGMEIKTLTASGKVKILEDFSGKTVKELYPSAPAIVMGFDTMPIVGEEFIAGGGDISDILVHKATKKETAPVEDKATIVAILKADVAGSLEVLKDVMVGKVKVLDSSAGDITDGDIKSAIASGAVIIAFRTKFDNKTVEVFAKNQSVLIFSSDIIYELIKSVDEHIEANSIPEVAGRMEVLAIFGKKDGKQVIGGRVIEGVIRMGKKVEIKRKSIMLGDGKIVNLQTGKVDTKEVEAGIECGILIDSIATIKVGDELSQTATK